MLRHLLEMKEGIQFKFLILVSGLALAMLIANLISDAATALDETRSQRLDEATSITAVAARSLEKQFDLFELDEIEGILEALRSEKHITQVGAIDRDRTFYLDGDLQTSPIMSHEDVVEQTAAMEQQKQIHTVSENEITVAEPLIRNGGVVGSLVVRFKSPQLVELIIPIIKKDLLSILPVLVFGLAVGWYFVTQVTRPLKRLADSARAMAGGNMDGEIPIEGPLEVKQLGSAFANLIAALKENIEQIYELAYVDRTTRLPNREFFRKELTRSIDTVKRLNSSGALLFLDLDGFKRVNDTHGHDVGDTLLKEFSKRLTDVLECNDSFGVKSVNDLPQTQEKIELSIDTKTGNNKRMVARLGGDEFTVLLPEIRDVTEAAIISQRIIDAVGEPFVVNGTDLNIGASIGIAAIPEDGSDYQTILKSADMAMYQAKQEGKNTFRFFSAELNREAAHKMEIETDLRIALESNDQLELYYQPKVDCNTGRPKGAEALIRWNHPVKGMIPPLDFISVAEDCALILPLGTWVLRKACEQLAEFERHGIDVSVAVNISPAQFERPELTGVIKQLLAETGANPAKLELELTESMAMKNPDLALRHIVALKELGIRFAVDDFGTGYSNLSQLSRLPFDVFKIDRSFIDMLSDRNDEQGRIIVRTILAMANSMNYETVAEGVESISQLEFISEYGCTFAQGYYFARPLPVSQFVEWYSGWQQKDDRTIANILRQGAIA